MSQMIVEYLPHFRGTLLGYAKKDDAGFDLMAAIPSPIRLAKGDMVTVPTGVRFDIPSGPVPGLVRELQIRSRSGLAAKHGIFVVNSPGTIDQGYRGEIKIILGRLNAQNDDSGVFVINPGDRIAQAVYTVVEQARFWTGIVSQDTDRGDGGFGSTGVRS